MDINKQHSQAQHEVRQTSREDAPTGRTWAEGEEMRAARLQEFQEMAAKLLATARELPPGPNRQNALQLIGRFRVRIVDLQRPYLPPAQLGLKAKGK